MDVLQNLMDAHKLEGLGGMSHQLAGCHAEQSHCFAKAPGMETSSSLCILYVILGCHQSMCIVSSLEPQYPN